ncbi:hypothetical protein RBH26_08795 [Natronolimnohabitans sp. A-GB9]|uniref:hypothetical protein n=1 Tax=Natronolimnohabitans sp. A-GB9 TaxID=3069757 RepID=UPI0027B35161|nr:hypothetical protein [Natronolimnohabitans sp. A-GB9]MDQ2050584.1 hypothetical protein [Natronolimnohabitans sp. A-GB9]
MCAMFTDDDVGKPVENGNGEEVGVVASVDGDRAHVRPTVDAVDSVKSSIGWEGVADVTRPLEAESIREITDEAVRLEGTLPVEDKEDSGAEADPTARARGDDTGTERKRGLEADPTELIGDREPGVRTGISVDPDEDYEPTNAAIDPNEDYEPTNAAVDPDAITDPESADGEPTSEDTRETDLEDGPEQERLTDFGDETESGECDDSEER